MNDIYVVSFEAFDTAAASLKTERDNMTEQMEIMRNQANAMKSAWKEEAADVFFDKLQNVFTNIEGALAKLQNEITNIEKAADVHRGGKAQRTAASESLSTENIFG